MQAKVRIVISELSVALEDLQLREIISISTNMASFAKLQRFSEYRPTSSIVEDPAAWWRYAIQAVMLQIRLDRSKKMRLSLQKFTQRLRDKRVYMELWMSRLVSPQSVVNQLLQLDHTCKPPTDHQSLSGYRTILHEANQSRRRNSRPSDYDDDDEEVGTEAATSRTTAVRPLDASGIELLHALEYALPLEDIVLFRSLAEQQLSSAETTHQSWI
jgi:vacuolar protein sorting-associated protein 13A/C